MKVPEPSSGNGREDADPDDVDPPGHAIDAAVSAALAEDLGLLGDITSRACVPTADRARAILRARERGVLAGSAAATAVFARVDPDLRLAWHRRDGAELLPGTEVCSVVGSLQSILTAERSALNFLTHLSGIATLTRRYVERAAGSRIRDTRKTLPGLRALEKAAVRAGGGFNHRDSLSDAVLIKDNHLAGRSLTAAAAHARARWPGRVIEVECDTAEQVEEAAGAPVDLVLLDNMTVAEVRAALAVLGASVPAEVSGGITLENVAEYAALEPAFIAVGAITHSAPALDLGLDVDADRNETQEV